MDDLKGDGSIDGEGFAAAEAWLDVTADHEFPDAVVRLYDAMNAQVSNQADILVSLQDGYYSGHPLFDRIVSLLATHGSARAASSTGFMMSTHRTFPSFLRAAHVPKFISTAPGHGH